MDAVAEGMRWFKGEFGPAINARLAGTPYSLDLLTAIATQETFYIWSRLYRSMPTAEILKLCVGDTLDAPNRAAFPATYDDLVGAVGGDEMFAVGRAALTEMARHVPGYEGAAANPRKFCHGYGIFQYDLQHFRTNPSHFLSRGWHDFATCLELCVKELDAAFLRTYGPGTAALDDEQMVYVAIAYNRGQVDFARGFKQGHRDATGKYYGEHMWDYLQLAHRVEMPTPPRPAPPPAKPRSTEAGLF